ncbi:unnamed protein product [Sphagnum balticum]
MKSAKSKNSSVKRRLTVIKVLGHDQPVTRSDLEKWHKIFVERRMSLQQAVATGEVFSEMIPVRQPDSEENYMTLVRVGDDEHLPTIEDLEGWRKVFEESKGDPDFMIFTYPFVDISVIKLGDIVAVE